MPYEDYKTRKDRLTKTKRKSVQLVFPQDIYEAFKEKCRVKGWKYNERILHYITRDISK